MKNYTITLALIILISTFLSQTITAQEIFRERFLDEIEVGFSGNLSTLHYEEEGDALNDLTSYGLGFSAHIKTTHAFNDELKLRTGLELFVFKFNFDQEDQQLLDVGGQPIDQIFRYTTLDPFYTVYAGIPIDINWYAFSTPSIYISAGTQLMAKVAYRNTDIRTDRVDVTDNSVLFTSTNEYNVPELANDFITIGNFGIGYEFTKNGHPLRAELKIQHSITPYLSGDNFINSYIRGGVLSLKYGI